MLRCEDVKLKKHKNTGRGKSASQPFNILASVFLIFLSLTTCAYRHPETYVIDAAKNAQIHNNKGLAYMEQKVYSAAIQEFRIAISLNTNSQASSTYYDNLGRTYMLIGHPKLAQDCFERALIIYNLDFRYYKDLTECFKAQGILPAKIKQYSAEKSPLSKVMLGLLYKETGDLRRAVIILDDFAMSEPDLLITSAVKQEIKDLIKQINR
jgi:tetratricopeptide (TPR) repeat protein